MMNQTTHESLYRNTECLLHRHIDRSSYCAQILVNITAPLHRRKGSRPKVARTINESMTDEQNTFFFPNKINLVISVRDNKIVGIVSLLHNGVRKCEKETGTIMILIVLVFVGSDARSL